MAKRVLVIEDEVDTLSRLREYLESKNYVMYTAEDEQHGLTLLRSLRMRGAVISLDMQENNGFRVLSYVCSQFPQVPCIAMSSRPSRKLVLDAFAAGVRGHISKPIVHDQLQELLFIFEGHLP